MRCHQRYLLSFFLLFALLLILFTSRELWMASRKSSKGNKKLINANLPRIIIMENMTSTEYKKDCRMYSCFDIFKCSPSKQGKIKVYIYPETQFTKEDGEEIFPSMSSEYKEILKSIRSSHMYTADPQEACIFIPALDTLNEIPLQPSLASTAFSYLDNWNDGQNHLIINMVSKGEVDFNHGMLSLHSAKAMVAGADFHVENFRKNFDISIPMYNSFTNIPDWEESKVIGRKRDVLVTLMQPYDKYHVVDKLKEGIRDEQLLVLHECEDASFPESSIVRCEEDLEFDYPEVLRSSKFCFFALSETMDKSTLLDAMMMGCVPVIMSDGSVLPFSEVLDWQRASVQISPVHLHLLPNLLKKMSREEVWEKQLQAFYLWKNYFGSLEKVVLTTLDLITDRLVGKQIRQYEKWNDVIPADENGQSRGQRLFIPPIFFPMEPKAESGFTAVILTYNRVQMLHTLMERLSKCRSLAKIVVVWNNVHVSPPKESSWPKLPKPWVLIRQKTNRLSNRFFPYKEIETEAVLAIDDDILMLTTDEIEFAFATWLEFHDRLVGFPGRFHVMDSAHQTPDHDHLMTFRYESEWSNDVSMVLTGAAFYHKVYNHYYTYVLPAPIRNYVDEKMNCEDIAMNFLIANLTGKAPIKVAARKRFKCSQCRGNDSLWSESSHFVKRSECLSIFTDLFGYMPLKSVEFRADPVLFHENVPVHLKEFYNTGTL